MVSQKQIDANRCNAQKSTGPRTPEGKAAVSMNSLQHGLRASRIVLPGESEEKFHQLCADLETDWRPQTRTQQLLLEEMAVSQWKLQRFEDYENQIMSKGVLNKEKMGLLVQLVQQQSRLKNSFLKCMRELERLQKNRPANARNPETVAAATATNILEFTSPEAAVAAIIAMCPVPPDFAP